MFKKFISIAALSVPAFLGLAANTANAGAVHNANLFTTNFAGNDDSSVGTIALGFNIDFYSSNFNSAYVNNNGNITFTQALGTYTPFAITGGSLPMLAPFFADVDTRVGQTVTYGANVLNGHNVFGVNWLSVGYYSQHTDKVNTFQLIVTDRSDTGAGNFDFEFNYDSIMWETGDASSGSHGFGGSPAHAGWTNGNGTFFEFAGSGVSGSFEDSNIDGLIHGSRSSNVLGQYIFQVRNGQVIAPVSVPEPSSFLLMLLGVAGVFASRKTKKA